MSQLEICGDSHGKLLFSVLARWFAERGEKFRSPKLPHIRVLFGRQEYECLKKKDIKNTKMYRLAHEGLGGSVVLANFGQHNAAMAQWNMTRYLETIQRFVKNAKDTIVTETSLGRARHVVWIPNNYFPVRNDGWVRVNYDGRSLGRISAYNDLASRQMYSAGIRQIDNVSPTNHGDELYF